MVEVVSKCGMNCAGCPWSPITRKDLALEDFPAFAKQALRYFKYADMRVLSET